MSKDWFACGAAGPPEGPGTATDEVVGVVPTAGAGVSITGAIGPGVAAPVGLFPLTGTGPGRGAGCAGFCACSKPAPRETALSADRIKRVLTMIGLPVGLVTKLCISTMQAIVPRTRKIVNPVALPRKAASH